MNLDITIPPPPPWKRGENGGLFRQHGYMYRCFDAEGVLLYVGFTNLPVTRMGNHRSGTPWWSEVARVDFEVFDHWSEAEQAERTAIRNEAPRYNLEWNQGRGVRTGLALGRKPRVTAS